MTRKHSSFSTAILVGSVAVAFACGARAQSPTTNDDFTQAHDNNSWQTYDGACLTAGDGTGTIPACVGLPYYRNQIQVGGSKGWLGLSSAPATGIGQAGDPAGQGALRFTNGYTAGHGGDFNYGYKQAGSIISSGTPYPTGSGLQVIFKTVTYRGDSGGGGSDGADGIGFFLMDGSLPPYDTGAFGGSLGYTCSNEQYNYDYTLRADGTVRGYDGLVGGYIGLGIDEYGNFLNQGDNTASGYGYVPGRIGLRGRGSISFAALNKLNSTYYPSSLLTTPDSNYVTKAGAAVHNTCQTGYLWDYSTPSSPQQTSTPTNDYTAIPGAYAVLSNLLPGKKIANEAAMTRGAATPITYNLKITQDGILSLYVSYGGATYLPVITKQSIKTSNGPLPASFRFGFTGSTGGSNNIHEVLCFQASPADAAGTSVGVNAQEAAKIASGTQAYLAYYYPNIWTGRLTANDLLYDATTQSISISATSNWDASCNLTGVPNLKTCPTTLAAGPVVAQGSSNRTILTWNGSNGVAFQWTPQGTGGGAISTAQQNALDQGDASPSANRLNYLRGDRSNEINTSGVGLYRARDGVLGDIVDSSPTWVGPPTSHYAAKWEDRLVSGDPTPENTGTQNFNQYIAAAQTRLNVVYNGANDGFLHGFESGAFDSTGNYVNNSTYPNDGKEVLAYMPAAVLNAIHNTTDPTLDYSNSQYSHNFYVDATPEADDLFYGGTWHTWLVGGLGAGGAAVYALDITNPGNFSEANASTLVKGEWSSANIACQNVASCNNNMGNTYGTPIIRRLHDGKWAIIFGNGFGSASGDAGIFVMLLDPSTGATSSSTTYYLSTGKAGTNDGIAYVSSADLDGDHITDYVYAGDLLGNVWRFDLTSGTESAWVAGGTPLFTTSSGQPITTKLAVVGVSQPFGSRRLMVEFGTGQKIPQTNTTPAAYATGTQSLYGVWDWNMANWNSLSSSQYTSLASGSATVANLTAQTLTANADTSLDITSNTVCWSGSTVCSGGTSGNTKFGWKIALPGTQEQILYNPLVYQNSFIINTTIPATNSPTSCQVTHDTGNTIAIAIASGGALGGSAGSFFKNTTDTNAAGSLTNGTGQVSILQAGGNTFMMTQSLGDGSFNGSGSGSGPLHCTGPFCQGSIKAAAVTTKRLTWVQRR